MDKKKQEITIGDVTKILDCDKGLVFIEILYKMAVETNKYGDHAWRLNIKGLEEKEIARRTHRLDFFNEIIRLFPLDMRVKLTSRILK